MYHTVPWFTGAVPPGAPPLSLPFAAAPMLSALQTYQERLDQDFLARFGVSPLTLPGARAAPTGAPCATAAATVGPSGGAGKKAAGDGGKAKAHATHSTLQDLNNARKTAPIFNRTMSAPADTPDARDAAHVDAARQHTTQLLRQSGDIGKDMIEGEEAVGIVDAVLREEDGHAAGAAAAGKTAGKAVPPQRNASRDKQVGHEVVNGIATHGMRSVNGIAPVWRLPYFSEFKVPSRHPLSKYALCRKCVHDDNFHLARVSRGNVSAASRNTSNVRAHLQIHHPDLYEDLLKHEGKLSVDATAGIQKFLSDKESQRRGPACQNPEATMDALLQMITEDLQPWEKLRSSAFKAFARSIKADAWVPCVDTVQSHARRTVRPVPSLPLALQK